MGTCDIDSVILSTSGVSSCIAVVIELENKIFIYHADPGSFNALSTCSTDDARTFLMKIFSKLRQLDADAIIKNVFIIGGWNDSDYITLRNKVDIVSDRYTKTMKQKNSYSSSDFHAFICAIKLNLIEEDEDDDPNDYVVDFTLVYDRSSTPHLFFIYQYAGREEEMDIDRHHSLLHAVYRFDAASNHFRAYICSDAHMSPNYPDLFNQILSNVNDQSCISYSWNDDDDILKGKTYDLLSRIK